jgi:hypothetical protein
LDPKELTYAARSTCINPYNHRIKKAMVSFIVYTTTTKHEFVDIAGVE